MNHADGATDNGVRADFRIRDPCLGLTQSRIECRGNHENLFSINVLTELCKSIGNTISRISVSCDGGSKRSIIAHVGDQVCFDLIIDRNNDLTGSFLRDVVVITGKQCFIGEFNRSADLGNLYFANILRELRNRDVSTFINGSCRADILILRKRHFIARAAHKRSVNVRQRGKTDRVNKFLVNIICYYLRIQKIGKQSRISCCSHMHFLSVDLSTKYLYYLPTSRLYVSGSLLKSFVLSNIFIASNCS